MAIDDEDLVIREADYVLGTSWSVNRLGRAVKTLHLLGRLGVLALPSDFSTRVDVRDRAVIQTELPPVRDVLGRKPNIVGLEQRLHFVRRHEGTMPFRREPL